MIAISSQELIPSGTTFTGESPGVPGSSTHRNGDASNRGPVRPAAPSPRIRDAQLSRAVEQALRATGYLEWENVRIHASEGQLVLAGVVPSHFLKQVAQTAARRVPGVNGVRNELSVTE